MTNNSKIEMIISARYKDLGGLSVRRILPYVSRRMVGPIVFFDHMGPAEFRPGSGMDVRPHPHINLATVTYLFEGRIRHRDSLGSDQVIEPGAVNWMTAGRGIVHSERTPVNERRNGSKLNGIQLWVALPEEYEEIEPEFTHYPKESLPEFRIGDATAKLLLGSAYGHESPVKTHSDIFYMDVRLKAGGQFELSTREYETAFYVVQGGVDAEGTFVRACNLAICRREDIIKIEALEDTHLMLLGGQPLGPRFLYWNFVSSSKDRIEEAKRLWSSGLSLENPRFHPIPGDDQEFIPLPQEPGAPKGTIM